MLNRLNSLLWLRFKILLSSKAILFVCVVTPILDFILLQAIPMFRGNVFFLNLGLSLIYSLTAGTFTSMMVSEEKEKKMIRTFTLTGIASYEYFITVILIPFLASMLSCIALPLIFGISLSNWFVYILISILTSLAFILINFSIALWSKTQSQSSLYSLVVLIVVTVLSMLAPDFKWANTISQLTFAGANITYLSNITNYSLLSLSFTSLIVWLVLLSFLTTSLFKMGRKA